MGKFDVIVIGSGPNGLAAAVTLQQQGLSTLIVEGSPTIGGGMRTKELTLPGFRHDVCSAIHPMAMASPFMRSLPLKDYGLEFIEADYAAAHPLDNGDVALLHRSLERTAHDLGIDGSTYKRLISPVVSRWGSLAVDTMGPLRFPRHPLDLVRFGLDALKPATWTAATFKTQKAKALWAGVAAHGIQPLSNWATSAIGLVLTAVGHRYGWPIPRGGSQAIADALAAYYLSLGGQVQTGQWVKDVRELPDHKIVILDLTPKQMLNINGLAFDDRYRKQLHKYRYGMGVFKIDWALSEPTPFKDGQSQRAATVHLGNTAEEIVRNEAASHAGRAVEKPFVLFTQPSQFDKSRAPQGKHTAWAYCHVPHGSETDFTAAIEGQIERFAPGFKETILARHTFNPKQLETYNPNYIGGDINGGIMDIAQLYTRPTLSLTPYRTSNRSVYLCSSSTPPGGGVHGMCGYQAARIVLKDHFNIEVKL
ncbi:phytoene dehydrogenase-like protein [Sphingobacterium allocomposti]|uniref:Pyridine nucleotide-disulfide oxidoreductase domain-containing protein 2 n=1 Tax=Sphingobacterium allocomposti TaxID=415956 RepID=A0A5S5DLQ6_9SPHI|nr:NAD(P)/FAD-dependent oxidoreductase [Sphingobacterium composti Yoo et al. 2007 non Ten et al. 2007]TYP95986.1 phytoene dehydrogenase-like protein [Sphingobacterium composti Yoo et al. 2007 non Ten et al. 2007]